MIVSSSNLIRIVLSYYLQLVHHEGKKPKARGYPKILGVVLAGLSLVLSLSPVLFPVSDCLLTRLL